MLVEKISHVFDMYLNNFRTTEYIQLKDEVSGKRVTEVEQKIDVQLYDKSGTVKTYKG
jgi:hypothetical protein